MGILWRNRKDKKKLPPYTFNLPKGVEFNHGGIVPRDSNIPSRPFIGGFTVKDVERAIGRLNRGKTMNKKEAIQAMLDGEKVTHDGIRNYTIKENGDLTCNKNDSVNFRDTPSEGWKIYKEPEKESYNFQDLVFHKGIDGDVGFCVAGSDVEKLRDERGYERIDLE